MPFVEDNKYQTRYLKAVGVNEPDQVETTSFIDTMHAALQIDNSIVAFMNRNPDLPDSVIDNASFNPFLYLTEEEKLNENFVNRSSYADHIGDIDELRTEFARENELRTKIANGSGLAVFAAEFLEPVNYIPVGGAAYKTYKTGASILTGALATGVSAAAVVTAEEAALHQIQLTRTYGESAANIGGTALFGGVFGAGFSHLANKKILDDIDFTMNVDPKIANDINPTLSEEGNKSLSAAAAVEYQDIHLKDDTGAAKFVTKYMNFSPLTRTVVSESSETRKLVSILAENPTDFDRAINTSVETKIKIHDARVAKALMENNKQYKDYIKDMAAKGDVDFSGVRAVLKSGMNRRAFNEEVALAVETGSSTNPFALKAAQKWDGFYNQYLDELKQIGQFLKDIEVKTAKNYLNRVYDRRKIIENLPEFKQIVSKWLIDRQAQKTGDELVEEMTKEKAEEIATDIAMRITSSPEGVLPYDYQMGKAGSGSKGRGNVKGIVKERAFLIPDELIRNFLIRDIEELGYRYSRAVSPDIELHKAFGASNEFKPYAGEDIMAPYLKKIENDYTAKIDKAKTPKERERLSKLMERDKADIQAMIDRMRGVYNLPSSHPTGRKFQRVANAVKSLNYLRMMGGVAASSLPDVGRIVLAEGFVNSFKYGLKPLITNLRSMRAINEDMKPYIHFMDSFTNGRANIVADMEYVSIGETKLEAAIASSAKSFSKINLMTQWTAFSKMLHGSVVQTRVIKELLAGNYDKRLGQLGISKENSELIAEQLRSHSKKDGDLMLANLDEWTNPYLKEMWMGALRKESDRVILIPGQDKPLFMSEDFGSVLLQFKSFMLVSTNRILVSTLQRQDRHMVEGWTSIMALGILSYAFKTWDKGGELSDDPKVWVMEGIDRSGALGIIMEGNNMLERVSGDNAGLRPLLGMDGKASRAAAQSAFESALGPSFGFAADTLFKMANELTASEEAGGRDLDEKDVRAIRRLLPWQNLMILRQGFDKLEKEASENL